MAAATASVGVPSARGPSSVAIPLFARGAHSGLKRARLDDLSFRLAHHGTPARSA